MDQDFNLATRHAALYLQLSEDTVREYAKRGFLHPITSRSSRGTPKFLFCRADLDAFKMIDRETLDLIRTEQGSVEEGRVAQGSVGTEEDKELNEALNPVEDTSVSGQDSPAQGSAGLGSVGTEIVALLKEQLKEERDDKIFYQELAKNLTKAVGALTEQVSENTRLVRQHFPLIEEPKPVQRFVEEVVPERTEETSI